MAKIPVEERQLNTEQKAAVRFGEGPLLIIAGAGTGKTTVVTERIKYLITSGKAKPQEILALTFTEKASREMETRVDVALPYGVTQMWISTFHAFCDRVLRGEAINIGIDPGYKLMTEAETILFFRKNIFKFDLKEFRPLGNPTKFISGMIQHFSRLKDEDVSPQEYFAYEKNELSQAFRTYEELKVKEGVADYADLISWTLKLFRTRPAILKKYQQQFTYILIDEFQDTNFAQKELVVLLGGNRKNISVVGDDDQCLPKDTIISTPDGPKKIQKIRKSDRVLTGVGKGRMGISSVLKVWKREKKTDFITIRTASGKMITATENHNFFCYVPKTVLTKNHHYVYLMYRKNLGWRLGTTTDLAVRLKLERSADAIIGLRAYRSEEEARYYETYWSLKYSIPTSIFKERSGVMMQGKYVRQLYKQFNSEVNALQLANDLGVQLTRFHYVLDGVTRGQSKRLLIHVSLCHRRYTSKQPKGRILVNPGIVHTVNTDTSDEHSIKMFDRYHIPYKKSKKGVRVRITSVDIRKIEVWAKKIQNATGGFIETQSRIGKFHQVHLPAVVIPAGNLLPGHYLPVAHKNQVIYEQIIDVKREVKQEIVYDLAIERTHNFIANNIVVHNSIYRFRGAAISNIIQFRKTFPKAKIVVLTKNYRSTKEILDRSYDCIQHNNPDRLEVAEKIDKKLESMRRINGGAIAVLYAERVENEAEMVVKKIQELQTTKWSDIAILVRANNHAEPFVRALSRAGIPYQFLGPGQLFRQAEVKDLIAYLKVLYNFEDNVAMYRVLSMDVFGIPPRDIAVLVNHARKYGISLFESCEQKNIPLVTMIHKHMGMIKKETAGQILYYFLADTGLLKQLTLYKSAKEEKAAENIAKFFNKLKTYETEHEDASVFTVVDWIDLSMTLGESPLAADIDWSENNAVNILTVHSAKGLEFPIVFLVNLVSARFPTNERKEQIPIPDALVKEILPVGDYHEEEERRLFYVGMTRARDQLYFTGAKYYGEGKREKKLSPFIFEAIGNKEIKEADERIKQLSFLDWQKTEETIQKQKIIISYLSYSQLSTFMTCPLQYRYRYILRIPVPPSAALSFGETIHKVMYEFYLRKHRTKQDLLRLLDTQWSRVGYGDKKYEEKMKHHGRDLLSGFFEKGYDPKIVPTSLEEPFKLKITPTLTLGGKIDRIDTLKDGTKEIIDYKTGTAPKSRDPKKDLQLTVYAMAGGSDRVIVSFYFFEDQTKISATRTREQLAQAKKDIAQKADEISRSDFRPTPGKYCDFCEFRLICEAWT